MDFETEKTHKLIEKDRQTYRPRLCENRKCNGTINEFESVIKLNFNPYKKKREEPQIVNRIEPKSKGTNLGF